MSVIVRRISEGRLLRRAFRRSPPVIATIIVAIVAALFLMPLYWMFTGSLKLQIATMKVPPEIIPTQVTLQNYVDLFESGIPIWRWLLNSVTVSVGTLVGTLALSSLAGYSFAKKKFPGDRVLFFIVLAVMMLPKQISLIPLYLTMRRYGLYNTHLGMILPLVASPFGFFMMRQFISTIPNELIDAAKIDGASEWGIFWRVILPLSKPALAALGIFTFMSAWNDFMWQLVMAKDSDMMTLPIGVSALAYMPMGESVIVNIGLLMAGATFGAMPMLITFVAFQRYFVRGITVGAVKG